MLTKEKDRTDVEYNQCKETIKIKVCPPNFVHVYVRKASLTKLLNRKKILIINVINTK